MNNNKQCIETVSSEHPNVSSLWKGKKVLVVGDVMLDVYIYTTKGKPSPESAGNLLRVTGKSYHAGGAANVAVNLSSMGVESLLIGAAGPGEGFQQYQESLRDKEPRIHAPWLTLSPRPFFEGITIKTRVLLDNGLLHRFDDDKFFSIPIEKMNRFLERPGYKFDALLLSDYQKGMFQGDFIDNLIAAFRKNNPTAVIGANPKPEFVKTFTERVDLISVNEKELAQITDPLENIQALFNRVNTDHVLCTRGARGLAVYGRDGSVATLPAIPVTNPNLVGAGDATFAAATLALTLGGGVECVANLANAAGAAKVSCKETNPAPGELMGKFVSSWRDIYEGCCDNACS